MVVKLFAITVARARVLTGLAGGARAGWSACSSAGRNAHSVSRRCMVVITVVHWSREAAARACLLFCGLRARPASWAAGFAAAKHRHRQGRDCLARDGSWPGALHLWLCQALAQSMRLQKKTPRRDQYSSAKTSYFVIIRHRFASCDTRTAFVRSPLDQLLSAAVQAPRAGSAGRLRGKHE